MPITPYTGFNQPQQQGGLQRPGPFQASGPPRPFGQQQQQGMDTPGGSPANFYGGYSGPGGGPSPTPAFPPMPPGGQGPGTPTNPYLTPAMNPSAPIGGGPMTPAAFPFGPPAQPPAGPQQVALPAQGQASALENMQQDTPGKPTKKPPFSVSPANQAPQGS